MFEKRKQNFNFYLVISIIYIIHILYLFVCKCCNYVNFIILYILYIHVPWYCRGVVKSIISKTYVQIIMGYRMKVENFDAPSRNASAPMSRLHCASVVAFRSPITEKARTVGAEKEVRREGGSPYMCKRPTRVIYINIKI